MDFKKAIDSAQRAQRNYDLTKTIPQEDLDILIYAAVHSPSKQNETHYSLAVYTNQNIIHQIYSNTKKFTVVKDKEDRDKTFGEIDGKYWVNDKNSVTNSQILANVLFAYVEEKGKARNGNHHVAQKNSAGNAAAIYNANKSYSIGISAGQLILTANLLGYRTGICTAMNKDPIKKIIGTENSVKMLIGVGYPNANTDRRLHYETLNRDMPAHARTGSIDEKWRFPSFEKYTKVTINGSENT